MRRARWPFVCLLAVPFLFLTTSLVVAQERLAQADPELRRVEQMLEQAQKEIGEFRQKGGHDGDANHPGRLWAERLWEQRQHLSSAVARARATSESIHLFLHGAGPEAALARLDTVPADASAWEQLANVLLEAADVQKDSTIFIHRAEALLPQWSKPELRAQWGFALAQAYWGQGDSEKAAAALRAVREAAPESDYAGKAPAALEEIAALKGYGPALRVGEHGWRARDFWQRPTAVMERLGISPGTAVADVGSGEGYFTLLLAARVGPQGKVFAIDIEEKPLEKLRGWAREQGLAQIETILGASKDPRLPAGSVDVLLVVDTYHEMRDYKEMMKGMYRALRPGGRMGIIERSDKLGAKRKEYHQSHRIPVETVIEDAARAGFRLKSLEAEFAGPAKGAPSYLVIFEKPAQ